MLINCVECKLKVSDKAISCPHCGYPLRPKAVKQKGRKKLPNGFGQISEIKGRNLRKPFRAMVTVGTKANGKPLVKPLKPEAYFETYNDAYQALMDYNRNPYDFSSDITMNELFEKWFEEYKEEGKHSTTLNTQKRCWEFCSSIHAMPVRDVRIRHIKHCIIEGTIVERGIIKAPSPQQQYRIKALITKMLDYAVSNEVIGQNPAKSMILPKNIRNSVNQNVHHEALVDSELVDLWRTESGTMRDLILVQCYSGWRPGEILGLKVENVSLKDGIMVGGIKTKAGKDRKVPIHSEIRPIIEKSLVDAKRKGSEFLFSNPNGRQISYDKLSKAYAKINGHKPHDGRKTFVTLAKKYNMDEYAIKYIVGHSISDLTERVYTDREFQWLKEEIEKIKVHAEVTKSVGVV